MLFCFVWLVFYPFCNKKGCYKIESAGMDRKQILHSKHKNLCIISCWSSEVYICKGIWKSVLCDCFNGHLVMTQQFPILCKIKLKKNHIWKFSSEHFFNIEENQFSFKVRTELKYSLEVWDSTGRFWLLKIECLTSSEELRRK